MPRRRVQNDPLWEKQVALLGPEIEAHARLLRELCLDVTRRESQIAALSEKGLRNGEIAEVLGISISTVDNHTSSVRHKLNVPSHMTTRKLISYAIERKKLQSSE